SVIRAWVAGCSTGEEAYSLAIVLKEALDAAKTPKNMVFQIFATDLDRDAIERARIGIYPPNIAADVSPERLRRFFLEEERGYRVGKEIREMVVFAPQNLIMDPPFTRLDLLTCRNVLIYLSPELQKKLIPLFHYTLNPGGILFLGSAETIGAFTGLFETVDGKSRIYRRLEVNLGLVEFPAAFTPKPPGKKSDALDGQSAPPSPSSPNLQVLVDQVLVQRFSPAAVLTSDKGDILYISGRTGRYLEPAAGRATMNIFTMARDGLRLDLSSAFSAALREDRAITLNGVRVGNDDDQRVVNLTVQKLTEPKELRGTVMVVITDVPGTRPTAEHDPSKRTPIGARVEQLQKELHRAHDEVQTIREEMQTSQEELKSTNEELQSTNEELQSTNEELTTSKEEMQSMNEELQTVNHELQSKLDELSRSSNDMKNLLNSTNIATLFLDGDLLVRRFTSPTAEIIKLIATDVGRHIDDIARDIDYPGLTADAREVIRTLVFRERLVPATQHRWFTVRVLPYRTLDNVIDGVVITFTDTSAMKSMEEALRQQASEFRQMAESLPNLVLGCRPDGTCDYVSPQWQEYTGASQTELVGHGWLHTVHDEERENLRQRWRAAVKSRSELDVEFRIRSKDGAFRWHKLRSVPINDAQGQVVKWYTSCWDVDDLKRAAERRALAAERLLGILEHLGDPYFALTRSGTVSYVNLAAGRLLGRPSGAIVGKAFVDFLPSAESPVFRMNSERALREGREMTFDTDLRPEPNEGRFVIRLLPDDEGLGIFLQRSPTAGGGSRKLD
ncbi:MAG TPA: CheR family methyltransferase, partial [Polyangiaceae bacterium]|nr:CheR family methyltransferase [Polyangiaceae bacterium]